MLKELLVHPKIIETELLLGGEVVGLQTWPTLNHWSIR